MALTCVLWEGNNNNVIYGTNLRATPEINVNYYDMHIITLTS